MNDKVYIEGLIFDYEDRKHKDGKGNIVPINTLVNCENFNEPYKCSEKFDGDLEQQSNRLKEKK